METGNPKQLAILGVVAVGAIGFLFTRLAGKAAPALAQAVALAKTRAKSPSIGALTVSRDPFSHPNLAPKPTKPEAIPVSSFAMAKPAGMTGAPAHFGPLPAAANAPLMPLPSATEPLDPGKPAEAGRPETPRAPERTTIGLEAIAGASEAVAFLTVGGGESHPFHPHDRVKGAIRLLRVQDGSVVLSGPKGETTLDVGERKSL